MEMVEQEDPADEAVAGAADEIVEDNHVNPGYTPGEPIENGENQDDNNDE